MSPAVSSVQERQGSYLNDVVAEGAVELDVRQEARVVAGGEAGLHDPLSVSEDVELRQSHVRGHLYWLLSILPAEFEVWGGPE